MKYKKIINFIIIVCYFTILFSFYVFKKNISLELVGNSTMEILLNSEYKDNGFRFKVNNRNKKVDYKVYNNINVNQIGEYTYEYKIKYNEKDYDIVRKIKVVDKEAPKIEVDSKNIIVSKCKKNTYDNVSFVAIDNSDGDITNKVDVTWNDHEVVLTALDSSGNSSSLKLNYNVNNDEFHLELIGNKNVYLKKGELYVEKGAVLKSSCGKVVDKEITIEGKVNTFKTGIYYILYKYDNLIIRRRIEVYDYKSNEQEKKYDNKVIYLTFDDGPGKYTEELLDILDKYNIKATFFVTNQFTKYVPLIKEEYERGHSIGVHSLTHNWNIYNSLESYLNDFNKMNDIVKKYTGTNTKIYRFPGGASNTISRNHATGIVSRIASYMNEKDYVYFDWNVDSTDASGGSTENIIKNVINGIERNKVSYILMHDIKINTLNAIEEILKYGIEKGYQFKTLDENVSAYQHRINN